MKYQMSGVKLTTYVHRCVSPLLTLSLLAACAAPGWQTQISRLNLNATSYASTKFDHLVVANQATTSSDLHVYIEGDGRPFIKRARVATDPTPRRSRMLELVGRDPYPALFVSRPCYFETMDDRCHAKLWTIARYSEDVIDSLAQIITDEWQARGHPKLTLIGYSGGATLALLLAVRLPFADQVITLNGNLDPERWAMLHGFTPLVGSMSPLDYQLKSAVAEFHVLGERDRQIPPDSVVRYTSDPARRRDNFVVCRVEKCSHDGCWTRLWPQFLRNLKGQGRTCEVLRRSGK